MPMGAADDEQVWISQSQDGDTAAFESLIRMHQQMIHSLTFRMTGSLADAEDMAQETFIRAYQQLGGYQARSKFSSWLYRIAINACLNWRQRELRRSQIHADWARDSEAGRPHSEGTTGGGEAGECVQAALMKLSPKQRAAIVLTVYDGLNHAETARILRCSETTVSWRIFAARNKLKRWLKPASRGSPER
jgi:RNA polymerase sigma-70 factor, ECF subfamily